MKFRWIAAALFLASTLGGQVWAQPQGQPDENAHTQEAGGNESQAQTPPSPPNETAYTADYERSCTNPIDQEDADLCQQWRSAQAAERVAAVSESQFWANIWEIGLLICTVVFTGWAAFAASSASRAAQKSIDVGERNAEAAEDAVGVARDNANRQLRAYVAVEEVQMAVEHGMPATILLVVRNYGQTPARKVDIRHATFFSAPDDNSEPEEITGSGITDLAPSQETNEIIRLGSGVAEASKHFGEGLEGAFYLYGRIDYIDAFDEPRWTTFRFHIEPEGPIFRDGPMKLGRFGNASN